MPEVLEKAVNTNAANVAVTAAAETVMLNSGRVPVPTQSCRVFIRAWAQVTTGAGTTHLTARIRRGSTAAGDLVGEGNAITIYGAAGDTQEVSITVSESRENVEHVQYCLTLQQTGAGADGSCLQAGIEVEVLNG